MRLNAQQLDELVHHLVHRQSNAEKGSAEYSSAREALIKLMAQYPDAGHMVDEHRSNMGEQWD
jgi:hypothetical protein